MDTIVNYLEDTEKKLTKEMAELFSKMRDQRDTLSLQGIEDMYSYKPVEGVLYEPCIQIPMSHGPRRGHYYWNNFTLPKEEYVIFTNETTQQPAWQQRGCSYNCIALTNHGRCFITSQVSEVCDFPTNSFLQYSGTYVADANRPIVKLESLPYKMPKQYFSIFLSGFKLAQNTVAKTLSDTTASLQELNKEFYLFAGKWKPHMTERATLDVETMRQTIIENAESIEQLKANEESLEQQNKKLQAELDTLKEQRAILEKEKTKLLPLEKYKDVVLEFMKKHIDCKKYKPIDSNIIDVFKQFHSDKVFMDSWVYNDVIHSKDELNEYRIYKKVKAEMVSNGMDNSGVARNVRSIKKTVNKLDTN
jgi:hypothetical protein